LFRKAVLVYNGIIKAIPPAKTGSEAKMKKGIAFLIVVLLLASVLLAGCEDGLAIVGMEIGSYPDRIVYVAGKDTKVDLDGGIMTNILKSGERGSSVKMDDPTITETDQINFSKPGVYRVSLSRGNVSCQFPIQVIDKDYVK
jgi:hypothetical protein